MVRVKVRKKDDELKLIAPAVKTIVGAVECIVVEKLGNEFDLRHKVNLYLGDRQRFANNPRSGRMYIQYRGIEGADPGPDGEARNLYITGILHEAGHSYMKIENALRRARESIAAEGLATTFALTFMDDVCSRLDPKSWLITQGYPEREKKWYADVFAKKEVLFLPLEAARFLSAKFSRETLFALIGRFNLKHRTYGQFLDLMSEVLGEPAARDFSALMDSFDLDDYAARYGKKV